MQGRPSSERPGINHAEAAAQLIALRDGWRSDDLSEDAEFYRFCAERILLSHAQNLQDLYVLFESRQVSRGYFVEFGATNGVSLSNTCMLEREHGWQGVVAEPARIWHGSLLTNRRCVVDRRCVWSRSGETLSFNQASNPDLSTIDQFSGGDMHAALRTDGTRYDVTTVSLNDLLKEHHAPRRIDYMSVDTEGSEGDILSAFDFDLFDVRLFTIEHNYDEAARQRVLDLMTSKGYARRFVNFSRWDDWFIRRY